MRVARYFVAAFLLALLLPSSVCAQSQVKIGRSIVALMGPWKFHTGDNPQWANPSFDDSAWGTISLKPQRLYIPAYRGASYKTALDFVPGWTAQGYPGYSGYAWYRLRVTVQEDPRAAGAPLSLCIPPEFDDAYQIYVDGRLTGAFGRFTPHGVTWYLGDGQMPAFRLDRDIPSGTTLTIALRVWMSRGTLSSQRYPGGLHEPPILGEAGYIDAVSLLHGLDVVIHYEGSVYLEIVVQLLAILVVFGLFWLDHGELAYLWLGLSCTISLVYILLTLVQNHTVWLSGDSHAWFLFSILPPLQDGVWLLFWGYWFRLGRRGGMAWLYGSAWAVVVLLAAALTAQQVSPYGGIAPLHGAAWLMPLTHGLEPVPGVLLLWIAFLGIRKNGFEGWLALPAVSLVALVLIGGIGHRVFSILGVDVPFARLATFLSLAIITLLMVRRSLHRQGQREQWRLEMEQARQVQQLLVPATAPSTPGFAVESVYLPASSVGGDFFHVEPDDDGSLLVVMGDVSGKGLKAAMLVSSIIGGLKQIATRGPAEVLAALNRQVLAEVDGGFVTCCALLLSHAGELTLANAGHLPPYLNGKEIAVDGALPLGLTAGAEFPVARFDLTEGDTLTLLSDGIVEAQDEHGQLFGFGRVNEMLRQPTSAAALAKAAQDYGQEDDITVLRIEFGGVREAVSA